MKATNLQLSLPRSFPGFSSGSKKVTSACEPTVTHQARAYPGFYSMKQLGVFLLPLDGMLVHPGFNSLALSLSVPIHTPGWTEAP